MDKYCSGCLREKEHAGICPFCGHDDSALPFDPQALEEGTLLCGGRYRISALVGKGGFGMTYTAWDQTLLAPVAIKEFFPAGVARRDAIETYDVEVDEQDRIAFSMGLNNFIREAHILAALVNVPHVVKVSNCFEENGTGYIVMEYVRGKTLMEYVREHSVGSGELLKMLRDPIDTLVLIHQQGVMHRDITPSNLMVQEDGTITLIDFGAAQIDERRLSGRSYAISATKHYAAPEQYDAAMQQGQWTDVYGLSATVYALLTGSEPQDARERMKHDALIAPRRLRAGITRRQEKAILAGLSVDPKNRLRSVEEFRAMLYNLPTPEAVRQRRRIVRRMASVTALLVVMTALLVLNFTSGLPLGGGLLYSLGQDGWQISGRTRDLHTRELPDRLLFLPVAAIGDGAFEGDAALERLSVPGSVRRIGRRALSGCENLQTVVLEQGVEEIAAHAFSDCPQLHTLFLPDSLCAMEENAFSGAPPFLTAWAAPQSPARAHAERAGLFCAAREDYEIIIEQGEAVLTALGAGEKALVLPSVIDGYRVTRMDYLCAIPYATASVVFPYYLREIPDFLAIVQPGALKSVTLGPHVKRIGAQAFADTGFDAIVLPEGLEEIGDKAFYFSALRQAEIPGSVRVIGEKAFDYTKLERIAVPDTVERIGSEAFSSNAQLASVVFPTTLPLEVMTDIFSGCTALERITIPASVKEIDMLAFSGCLNLKAVNLPDGVEEIGYGAFSGCIRLKYIGVPASVIKISETAFDGCSADLVIGGFPGTQAERYAQENGYRFEDRSLWTQGIVENGAIDAWDAQQNVVCPVYDEESDRLITRVEHLRSLIVHDEALKIRSIRLPLFAQEIGLGAISEEAHLERIVLPDTLRTIDSFGLSENTALEEIVLPQGLEVIENNAFSDCTALARVNLPPTLKYLGSAAFFGCASLTGIDLPPLLTELDYRVFSGSGLESVVVPSNIRACTDAFSDCLRLRSAVFEEGLRALGDAFEGCAALETVVLPATLTRIGENAFAGCTALKDVYFDGMDMVCWFSANGRSHLFSPQAYAREMAAGAKDVLHMFSDCPQVTLHGRSGSAAQLYAEAFGLKFERIDE